MPAATLTQHRARTACAHAHSGGILPTFANLDERTTVRYMNNGQMLLALRSHRHRCQAAAACRRLVSRTAHPMLQTVIDSDLLESFVHFLAEHGHPALQVDAAWVLTNVAAGTRLQTIAVARTGAMPLLVRLLDTAASHLLLSLVAWGLANIARELRDEVLRLGALPRLLTVLEHDMQTPTDRSDADSPRCEMIHLLCQLCRGVPRPRLDLVRAALPVLVRVAQQSHNHEVLANVTWAIESFVAGNRGGEEFWSTHSFDAAVDAGALPVLVALATHPAPAVAAAALHAILQVSIVNAGHAGHLVAVGVLAALHQCLSQHNAFCRACDVLQYLIKNGQLHAVLQLDIFPALFAFIDTTTSTTTSTREGAHVASVLWHACLVADLGTSSLPTRASVRVFPHCTRIRYAQCRPGVSCGSAVSPLCSPSCTPPPPQAS